MAEIVGFVWNRLAVVCRAQADVVGAGIIVRISVVIVSAVIFIDFVAVFDVAVNFRRRILQLIIVCLTDATIPGGGISNTGLVDVFEFVRIGTFIVEGTVWRELQLQ